MASIAQEESRKTSDRVKWGQKRRMEQGVVFGRDMLGYDVRDGKLYINEEGAEIVRLIFHKYVVEKKGTHVIARELREAGYKTITGNYKWINTVILKTIMNEKYCGDLVQKKTITPDFLTHAKKYNKGEEEMVIIRNHHEPIVSREIWEQAQAEHKRRSPTQEIKNKHSNRYALSGKIFCGACGDHFVARTKKRKDGSVYKAWRCFEAAQHGRSKLDSAGNHIGCDINCQIGDETLMLAVQRVVEQLAFNKKQVVDSLCKILKPILEKGEEKPKNEAELLKKLEKVKGNNDKLLDLYFSEYIDKEEYRRRKSQFETEIAELENEIKELGKEKELTYDTSNMLSDIKKHFTEVLTGKKQDEVFYKNIIDKIVVHSREEIDIFLNLLPHEWKIVVDFVLSKQNSCGSIRDTMFLYL